MNEAIVGISITYVALAALLLVIFFLSKVPAWIKFSCLVLVSAFYFMTYSSLAGLLGWPTRQDLPEEFQLLASYINEPNEHTGDNGSIHIWIVSFKDNRPVEEPRAFKLPYDLELHSSLEEALKKQRQGKIQLGRSVVKDENQLLPTDTSRLGQKTTQLEFSDLPDPELPEK